MLGVSVCVCEIGGGGGASWDSPAQEKRTEVLENKVDRM